MKDKVIKIQNIKMDINIRIGKIDIFKYKVEEI